MNYLFQHDVANVWSPGGLQRLLFAHMVTTFNFRVGKEMRRLTLGIMKVCNILQVLTSDLQETSATLETLTAILPTPVSSLGRLRKTMAVSILFIIYDLFIFLSFSYRAY